MWWRTQHERSEWQHFRQGQVVKPPLSKPLMKGPILLLLSQENPIVWEDYGTGGIIIGGPYMDHLLSMPVGAEVDLHSQMQCGSS